MTVKELRKNYKDYSIEIYGRPLKEMTIPYTLLPKGKPIEECIVEELEIEEKQHTEKRFSFSTGKWEKPINKKGYIRAYVK